MSLIEEFLEENLTKDLNHQLLAQIQQQNSAVQSLVSNLQGLRDKNNIESISNKIKRIEGFMELKKQVFTSLQPLNHHTSAFFEWVLNALVDNSFLYELIKRQEFFVQKQLIEIAKKVILQPNYLQQIHEDTELFNKILRELYSLNQQKSPSLKNVNRQRIKEVDYGMQVIEQKIKAFEEKVSHFNTEMIMFLRRVYDFDEKLRKEFYHHFKTDVHQPETLVSDISIKKGMNRDHSQKSHISIDSNKDSRVKLVRPQEFYEGQKTPMRFLETEILDGTEERGKSFERKSAIEKKGKTLEDRKSSQIKQIKSSIHENIGPSVEFQKVGMDYYRKRRPSEKYEKSPLEEELRSMNKTLSTLNYFNRPESTNMLYTTSNLGQQIRLPTKWGNNSRSTLSYYQPR